MLNSNHPLHICTDCTYYDAHRDNYGKIIARWCKKHTAICEDAVKVCDYQVVQKQTNFVLYTCDFHNKHFINRFALETQDTEYNLHL